MVYGNGFVTCNHSKYILYVRKQKGYSVTVIITLLFEQANIRQFWDFERKSINKVTSTRTAL